MNRPQKLLLLICIFGAFILLLKIFVMEHQVAHSKKMVYNSKRSDVQTIITVKHGGQLGNNIWEYMSLLSYMRLYESELNFTAFIPKVLKARMNHLFERVNIQEILRIPKSCLMKKPYVLQLNKRFQCDTFLTQQKCLLILSNFSARYKEVIQYGIDKIRNELRFKKQFVEYSHKVLNQIKTTLNISQQEVTFVGMHYRGTDYIKFLKKNYGTRPNGPPNSTYYIKAMDYFKVKYKTVVYVLITNDLPWLKKNIVSLQENSKYLVVNPNPDDFVKDLVLLSQCNHSIINYGTFGTTAALFAGGTTFSYNLGLPLDQRGPTVAMGIADILSNWHLLS